MGRQWVRYARTEFKRGGYRVIYTDTDSIYIVDPFHNKEKMLKVKSKIVSHIKSTVPFPQKTFDIGIDDEIKYMFFFKGGNKEKEEEEMDEDDFVNKHLGFMKKNYIYVTKAGKVKVKNLGIQKKSTSRLATTIFWKHLVPKIKEGQIKFSKTFLANLITEELSKDVKLAAMRKEVGNVEQYKNDTCLPAQIAKRYGSGLSFLIPNLKNIGVGKGKSFCSVEEFKEHKLKIDDINLDNVWKELDYFIKPVVDKNIFDF
jgi:DNA polymerase elongation subunit (family B)